MPIAPHLLAAAFHRRLFRYGLEAALRTACLLRPRCRRRDRQQNTRHFPANRHRVILELKGPGMKITVRYRVSTFIVVPAAVSSGKGRPSYCACNNPCKVPTPNDLSY